MNAIEPNVTAILWFALFASVASLSFYVLAGALPLETRPDLKARPAALALIGLDSLLLVLFVSGGLAYGITELRWTSVVILTGLAILFSPSLFNVWPGHLRDGVAGLAIVGAALGVALAALPSVFSNVHV